ncbi:MAG TPA: hypothetical protein VK926_09965, partial [Gaiellaceae bacterium]|nr:hypothetical protein [Gaiellaceae bacterium]
MSLFVRRVEAMFGKAMDLNLANIERALRAVPAGGRMLDLGCDDGARTVVFAATARAGEVHGVEVSAQAAELARGRGVVVTEA